MKLEVSWLFSPPPDGALLAMLFPRTPTDLNPFTLKFQDGITGVGDQPWNEF